MTASIPPAASGRWRRSAPRRCSSPPTRPRTSPARPSSSTAGRCSRVPGRAPVGVGGDRPGRLTASAPRPPRCATAWWPRSPPARRLPASGWGRSGSWRRLGVSRSTVRAALDSLEEAGVVHRVPGRCGGIFVSRAGSSAISPASPGCRPTCGDRASSPAPASSRRPRSPPTTRPRWRSGWTRTSSCSRCSGCGWPTGARLARARPLPGRPLPGVARPLAVRLALRPARGRLRPQGRRGGGADRGRRRDDRGAPYAGGAAGRSADLDRADGLDGRRPALRALARPLPGRSGAHRRRVRGRDASSLGAAVEDCAGRVEILARAAMAST